MSDTGLLWWMVWGVMMGIASLAVLPFWRWFKWWGVVGVYGFFTVGYVLATWRMIRIIWG